MAFSYQPRDLPPTLPFTQENTSGRGNTNFVISGGKEAGIFFRWFLSTMVLKRGPAALKQTTKARPGSTKKAPDGWDSSDDEREAKTKKELKQATLGSMFGGGAAARPASVATDDSDDYDVSDDGFDFGIPDNMALKSASGKAAPAPGLLPGWVSNCAHPHPGARAPVCHPQPPLSSSPRRILSAVACCAACADCGEEGGGEWAHDQILPRAERRVSTVGSRDASEGERGRGRQVFGHYRR